MAEKREGWKCALITIGIVLIVAELIGIAAILVWRSNRPLPVPETPTTATETVAATTEEEIIWETEPDDDLDAYLPQLPKNRFSAEDFGYEGDYLTCLAEPCMVGIDVSSYQGKIDWEQVRDAGIEFVMIRVGGRGYGEEGYFFTDTMADTYYAGAKAAGLKVGAYFFSQAVDESEALEEAYRALELTKDWELDLPLAFDWEFVGTHGRTAYVEMLTVADCTKVFCDTVKAAGREPMVYLSLWFGNPYLEELMRYPIWLALYTEDMTYPHHFDMWQYTSAGTVPGIKGDVDINIYFPPVKA